MITPELKDRVLKKLISVGLNPSFNIHDSQTIFNTDPSFIELVLDQFQDFRFLTMNKMLGGRIDITLTANAFDFVRKGGFTAQEAIEKAALDKLQLEIESLKKSFPEKSELFTSVLANIATVAGLFISG